MKLSKEDIGQLATKGIKEDKVEEQIKIFQRGNLPVNIHAAATVGKGINQYDQEQRQGFSRYYDDHKDAYDILKFVPASGAATRMFKSLHVFLDEFEPGIESLDQYLLRTGSKELNEFFQNMEKLPFYGSATTNSRENQPGFDTLTEDARKYILVQTILFTPGLNLSNLPKGLVPFHNYRTYVATAFEEHLYEAAQYAAVNGIAKLHFTVSENHKEKFQVEYDRIRSRVEESTEMEFDISYSYQDPRTDTIAVDSNNEPFRDESGKLFFRPGGHGALIENLNNLDADIVFIKNIDNVVVSNKAKQVGEYKKMLAGKLLKLQQRCFDFLEEFEAGKYPSSSFDQVISFIETELFSSFAPGFEVLSKEEKSKKIKDRLNRPIRVCGMVRNQGEPGGGPFLVNMEDGSKSLQIIEGAQIDENNPRQLETAQNATHFNPVDLVCGIKDYRGQTFNLLKYVDPATSFIANKTSGGKSLKALELPGLWNGAMARWNTVFIEVPVETFNPVKTVTDLLKPSHQVNTSHA